VMPDRWRAGSRREAPKATMAPLHARQANGPRTLHLRPRGPSWRRRNPLRCRRCLAGLAAGARLQCRHAP
jgi:hypothetical protein